MMRAKTHNDRAPVLVSTMWNRILYPMLWLCRRGVMRFANSTWTPRICLSPLSNRRRAALTPSLNKCLLDGTWNTSSTEVGKKIWKIRRNVRGTQTLELESKPGNHCVSRKSTAPECQPPWRTASEAHAAISGLCTHQELNWISVEEEHLRSRTTSAERRKGFGQGQQSLSTSHCAQSRDGIAFLMDILLHSPPSFNSHLS
mmetsp:Transcript_162546/g.521075  ORF Transcript_162546/g.521075 Transcript_162546/m.521075 type:complete len:201 (-) Transcript_162546:1727-2329(-)